MVQNVQAVQAPSFISPVPRGRGGLNVLNGWNDLNKKDVMRDPNVDV
jgi:hypothetical protein